MQFGSLSSLRSRPRSPRFASALTLDDLAVAFFAARNTPKLYVTADAARYQDLAATSPLTAPGQFFARVLDRSGGGNHVIQATAGKRPSLSMVGNLSFISADGADDGLYTAANLDLTGVNKITLVVGGRKRNSNDTAMISEFGDDFTTGGRFGLYSTQGSQAYYQFGVSGASNNPTPIIAAPQPTDTFVLVCQADLAATSGTTLMIKRNGVVQNDTNVPGSRNFASAVLNLLCRNQASLFAPFDLSSYALVGGPFPTAAELSLLEQVAIAKSGAVY